MKTHRTLGALVREQRRALGLSQVELARQSGVRPAYISIIEKGSRRPSLSLLQRLSDVLCLDNRQLFLLSRPEAKHLLRASASSQADDGDEAWRSFVGDRNLLARHRVKPKELELLAEIRKLGEARRPHDFVCILNAIRRALKAQ